MSFTRIYPVSEHFTSFGTKIKTILPHSEWREGGNGGSVSLFSSKMKKEICQHDHIPLYIHYIIHTS